MESTRQKIVRTDFCLSVKSGPVHNQVFQIVLAVTGACQEEVVLDEQAGKR